VGRRVGEHPHRGTGSGDGMVSLWREIGKVTTFEM